MKEKIANCGRPLSDFDTTYRTAMQFLENPCKIWTYGDLADKRATLKLTFEHRIRYNRNKGFRTAEAAVPFRIFNGLDGLDSDESEMVPRRGTELGIKAAEIRCNQQRDTAETIIETITKFGKGWTISEADFWLQIRSRSQSQLFKLAGRKIADRVIIL